jgi:cytochrome b subunit of formate dehydrogenase
VSPHADTRIKRFTGLQRIFHLGLMIAFLIQGASGLSRMFMEAEWGRALGWIFGGYEGARTIHIRGGIFMLCWIAMHIVYILFNIRWKKFSENLLGPDTLLPQPRDAKEFFQHIAWFVGLRSKPPAFGRWGYWEKFDYWAVFWGMAVIGITGMVMAFPLTATRIMPGWGLNVAFWVHRIEALLAMGHVFIIHFFIGHLRRHNFPMDVAMFDGSVDLNAVRQERPAWIKRLIEGGKMDDLMVPETGAGFKMVFYLFGYAAIGFGVFMLVGVLVNAGRITW